MGHRDRLSKEMVDAPSLETFMSVLDMAEQPDLDEDVPAHCRGLDQVTFRGPFQTWPHYDSQKTWQGDTEGSKGGAPLRNSLYTAGAPPKRKAL